MPTTSSPWASPSSPAGRRLLLTEPPTLDATPVLDDATLALGAALVAAASPTAPVLAPAHPSTGASVASDRSHRLRRPRSARRGLVAAALAIGVLAVAVPPVLDRPASSVPSAHAAPAAPIALGRAAGAMVEAAPDAPVADGQVVIGLIDPTETLLATPGGDVMASLGRRLGTLAALAVEERSPRGSIPRV